MIDGQQRITTTMLLLISLRSAITITAITAITITITTYNYNYPRWCREELLQLRTRCAQLQEECDLLLAELATCLYLQHGGEVQYSTVQYSTVQYSTVQYSTVQYSVTSCWRSWPPVSTCSTEARSPEILYSYIDTASFHTPYWIGMIF